MPRHRDSLPPLPPLPDRVCKNCEKVFTPIDPRQIYCRNKCCVQWHNRRATLANRLAQIELRNKALASSGQI